MRRLAPNPVLTTEDWVVRTVEVPRCPALKANGEQCTKAAKSALHLWRIDGKEIRVCAVHARQKAV